MAAINANVAEALESILPDELADRLSPRSHPDRPPITINPERLGGTPTIAGTRLPVIALIDHLVLGYDIDEFIDQFEGIERGDVQEVLLRIKAALAQGWLAETIGY